MGKRCQACWQSPFSDSKGSIWNCQGLLFSFSFWSLFGWICIFCSFCKWTFRSPKGVSKVFGHSTTTTTTLQKHALPVEVLQQLLLQDVIKQLETVFRVVSLRTFHAGNISSSFPYDLIHSVKSRKISKTWQESSIENVWNDALKIANFLFLILLLHLDDRFNFLFFESSIQKQLRDFLWICYTSF